MSFQRCKTPESVVRRFHCDCIIQLDFISFTMYVINDIAYKVRYIHELWLLPTAHYSLCVCTLLQLLILSRLRDADLQFTKWIYSLPFWAFWKGSIDTKHLTAITSMNKLVEPNGKLWECVHQRWVVGAEYDGVKMYTHTHTQYNRKKTNKGNYVIKC